MGKVLFSDAAHSKSKIGGTYSSTVGLDVGRHIVPLQVSFDVAAESSDTWWAHFQPLVAGFENVNSPDVVDVSDGDKGLEFVHNSELLSRAGHYFCGRHLSGNILQTTGCGAPAVWNYQQVVSVRICLLFHFLS